MDDALQCLVLGAVGWRHEILYGWGAVGLFVGSCLGVQWERGWVHANGIVVVYGAPWLR